MLGASSARAIGPVPTMPRTRLMPTPARISAAHALGMRKREKRGDARAHRIAHHVGAGDAEMVEQAARVLGHRRRAVEARVVELLAVPMPAIVEGDDAAPGLGQRAHPAGIEPIGRNVGGKAVDQEDGLALPPRRYRRCSTPSELKLCILRYRFAPRLTMLAAISEGESKNDGPWLKRSCRIS